MTPLGSLVLREEQVCVHWYLLCPFACVVVIGLRGYITHFMVTASLLAAGFGCPCIGQSSGPLAALGIGAVCNLCLLRCPERVGSVN